MKIIETLIEQNIDDLIKDFKSYSKKLYYDESQEKLIHPGEYGIYREKLISRFLAPFLPKNYSINSGFVVNNLDEISTQCDLIVYHRDTTPLISDYNNQEFYTAETVVAIGEIKSILNKNDFKKALNKLARCKMIRDKIVSPSIYKQHLKSEYNPKKNQFDTIISFLICEKLNFDISNLVNEISTFYENDIDSIYKHNMILSIEDGLMTYFIVHNGKPTTIHYPVIAEKELKNLLISDNYKYVPFKLFGSYFFQAITTQTVLYPDLNTYIKNFKQEKIQYEK